MENSDISRSGQLWTEQDDAILLRNCTYLDTLDSPQVIKVASLLQRTPGAIILRLAARHEYEMQLRNNYYYPPTKEEGATKMNAANTQTSMTFAVAELGAMKATVDSLAYSRNKTEQTKISKLVISFLSQMARVKGGKALNNVKLVSYTTSYNLEEDDLNYHFVLEDIPVKEKVEVK